MGRGVGLRRAHADETQHQGDLPTGKGIWSHVFAKRLSGFFDFLASVEVFGFLDD